MKTSADGEHEGHLPHAGRVSWPGRRGGAGPVDPVFPARSGRMTAGSVAALLERRDVVPLGCSGADARTEPTPRTGLGD